MNVQWAEIRIRTTPHHTGIGPDKWFYLFVVVLVGSSPRESGPGGQ